MLEITDRNKEVHLINLVNLNNVIFRKKADAHIISFHMRDHHAIPVTVDEMTAERIKAELKEMK